jgi:hypothetical protein
MPSTDIEKFKLDIWRTLVLDRHDQYLSVPAPTEYDNQFRDFCCLAFRGLLKQHNLDPMFAEWWQLTPSLNIKGWSMGDFVYTSMVSPTRLQTGKDSSLYRVKAVSNQLRKRLVVTNRGYLGMASAGATKGDLVYVLIRYSIPLVLREIGGGTHHLIGEYHLHGFMQVEAFKPGEPEVFDLI